MRQSASDAPGQAPEHAQFLQQAVDLAAHGVTAGDGGPFGAVIVRSGEVIGQGWNQVIRTNDPTAHAEVVAVRQACERLGHFQLTDAIVYCSCEPCPMCLGTLYWARPAAVYFAATKADAEAVGFDDSFIYDEMERSPADRSLSFTHLEVPGAREIFGVWAQQPGRVDY